MSCEILKSGLQITRYMWKKNLALHKIYTVKLSDDGIVWWGGSSSAGNIAGKWSLIQDGPENQFEDGKHVSLDKDEKNMGGVTGLD